MLYTITDQELQDLQKQFPSALNYLTKITVIQRESGRAGNAVLAQSLGVSKPAANQAIGRLKKLGLVEQDPYGDIKLTPEGKRFSFAVLRRHYLVEHLLISKLNYPWEKTDAEAQRLQAHLSEDFTEYLYEYLGRPDRCPHGNPFPGAGVEAQLLKADRLDQAPLNQALQILRITEVGEAVDGLLPFCHEQGLMPGRELKIRHSGPDGILALMDGEEYSIPGAYAAYICYKEL